MGNYESIFSTSTNTLLKDKYLTTPNKFTDESFIKNNKKYESIKSQLQFKETWTILPNGGKPNYGRRFSYNLPNFPQNGNQRHVYKNLRFSSDKFNNIIDNCELNSGGSRIDKIYTNLYNVLRHVYNINNDTVLPFYFCSGENFLPCSENSQYSIIMEALTKDQVANLDVSLDDLELYVDVYYYEVNKNELPTNLEWSITSIEHGGGISTRTESNNLVLLLKELCSQFIVYIPNRMLEDFSLFLDNIDSGITIDNATIYDNHYIFKFSDFKNELCGLNFSNVSIIDGQTVYPKVKLTLDSIDNSETIYFYNLCLQSIKFEDGRLSINA